jgi:hypothetical protein
MAMKTPVRTWAGYLVASGLLACGTPGGADRAEATREPQLSPGAGSQFVPRPSPLGPIDLRKISAVPKTFLPQAGEPLSLRLAAGAETPVRVELRSEDGGLVRSFLLDSVGPVGAEVQWDGRDEQGVPAPTGVYLYRMYALDEAGRVRGSYGDPAIGGGDEVLAQRFTFDAETGTVEFTLPEPARVRLRMGIQNLPILRTYYSWEPLEAGRHRIEWDGLDTTGKIRVVDHPKFRADLTAQALPQNAVYLRREVVSTQDPCAELCFGLELPSVDGTTDDGTPVVGDELYFRIRVDDPQERARMINSRFEIMVFLDTLFVFEEEDGAVPFNHRIDTRALNPGPHLLTVNVLAYDQRVGVQTLEFVKRAH